MIEPGAERGRGASAWLLDTYCTLDRRTLGLTRLLLGWLLLADLFRRLPWWFTLYTEAGLFPTTETYARAAPWSLLYYVGSPVALAAVFVLAFAIFVAFFVGYRTRLAHVATLVLVTSLDGRALAIENGGNIALNLLVLWTLFLPMGDRFSVDALLASLRRRRERSAEDLADRREMDGAEAAAPCRSLAALALLLQIAVIYGLTAAAKSGAGWRDFTAVRTVLHVDRIATPLAATVRDLAPMWLFKLVTGGVVVGEKVIAWLVIAPVFRRACRWSAIVSINALHLGLGVMLLLGEFSWTMCVYSTLLFAAEDWGLAARALRRVARARVVVFDPDVATSLAFARVVARLDRFELLGFRAAPGLGARFAIEREGEPRETGGGALAQIVAALPLGPLVAPLVRVAPIGRLFELVASRLGAVVGPASRPRSPGATRALVVAREGAVAFLLFAAVINATHETRMLRKKYALPRPEVFGKVSAGLRLVEGWMMFADVPRTDGALVVDAITADGRHVDPFTGRAPSFDLAHARDPRHDQLFADYAKAASGDVGLQRALQAWVRRYPVRTGRAEDAVVGGAVHWIEHPTPVGDAPAPAGAEDKVLFELGAGAPEPGARERRAPESEAAD